MQPQIQRQRRFVTGQNQNDPQVGGNDRPRNRELPSTAQKLFFQPFFSIQFRVSINGS